MPPEGGIFLGHAELVRADHRVQELVQAGLVQLQAQGIRVSVGRQHQPLAGLAGGFQKIGDVGQYGDQAGDFRLEAGDVQFQRGAPVIEAVPFDAPFHGPETRNQAFFGLLQRQAVLLGVAQGHEFAPEVIVEIQVEQGAVHVEQHRVDLVPGKGHT
jgi:hypothetical protein